MYLIVVLFARNSVIKNKLFCYSIQSNPIIHYKLLIMSSISLWFHIIYGINR